MESRYRFSIRIRSIIRFTLSALLIVGGLLSMPSVSHAQFSDVPNIFFDTVRAGDIVAKPIGVDDVKFIGTTAIGNSEKTILLNVATIVRNDLEFCSDFDIVPIDSFYLKTYEIKELDLAGWKRLGATYAVRLEAEFPNNNLRIYWRLFETRTQTRIAEGKVEDNQSFFRELSHDIANQIVQTLTGEPGIFRTSIVYVRKMARGKELFLSDFDGYNERQLTRMNTICLSPNFAPNMEEVYFVAYTNNAWELHRVHIQTAKVTRLAGFAGLITAPRVSPKGDQIACVLTKDGNAEIYLLGLDGKIIRRLTNSAAIESAPTWSPDGGRIAFTSDRTGSPQVYVMNSDGTNVSRLTFEGKYNDSPLWSLRGERVTFVSRTSQGRFDLASINTDGSNYRVLTQLGQNENPHFSPDGKQIIFASTRLGGSDVFSMDLTGRNQRKLTKSGDASNPTWGPIR